MLVTRPRFDAARTAERLSGLGHEALIDSVIEIETLPFDASGDGFSAIVFTSANAVRAAASQGKLKSKQVFAVGARTAEVARENGFEDIRAAGGDVVALGELVTSTLPSGAKVLHFAGEDRAGDLPGRLARSGITVEPRIVYRARVSGRLKPETVVAFHQGGVDAVLHYSERSAAAFVRLAEMAGIAGDIGKARHLCLSSAVAGPLKSFGVRAEIAAFPSEDALFALLGA